MLAAMLKTYFILTVLLFLCCIKSKGQQMVADSIAKRLRVQTTIQKTFFSDNKTPGYTYTEFYDTTGKMTQQLSLNNHTNIISIKKFFFYNNKGQLIKEKNIHFNYYGNDSTVSTQNYSYNSTGQLSKNFKGKIKYQYDNKGRVIESIEKTAKPSDLKKTFTYDSLGQLKLEETYFYNSIEHKKSWDYNNKRQIIKETSSYYDSQNNLPTTQYENTFIYNEQGLVTTKYQKQTIVSITDNKADNRVYTFEYSFY
jgi:hypothetical protein